MSHLTSATLTIAAVGPSRPYELRLGLASSWTHGRCDQRSLEPRSRVPAAVHLRHMDRLPRVGSRRLLHHGTPAFWPLGATWPPAHPRRSHQAIATAATRRRYTPWPPRAGCPAPVDPSESSDRPLASPRPANVRCKRVEDPQGDASDVGRPRRNRLAVLPADGGPRRQTLLLSSRPPPDGQPRPPAAHQSSSVRDAPIAHRDLPGRLASVRQRALPRSRRPDATISTSRSPRRVHATAPPARDPAQPGPKGTVAGHATENGSPRPGPRI